LRCRRILAEGLPAQGRERGEDGEIDQDVPGKTEMGADMAEAAAADIDATRPGHKADDDKERNESRQNR